MHTYFSVVIIVLVLLSGCTNPTDNGAGDDPIRIADGVNPDWVTDGSAITARGLSFDEYGAPIVPNEPREYTGPSGGQEFLYFFSPTSNKILKKITLGDETTAVMEHAWSNGPGSSRLAYTLFDQNSYRYKLMCLDDLDGDPVQLHEDSSPIICLSWSVDNGQIAFTHPGRLDLPMMASNIVLINSDGTGSPEPIANSLEWGWNLQTRCARCAADGAYLIYVAEYYADRGRNIYRIGLSGGEPTQLTHYSNKDTFFLCAELSPDGRTLAFIKGHPQNDYQFVYLQGLPDGEPIKVKSTNFNTFTPDVRLCESLAWSPDGQKLAVGTRFPLAVANDDIEIYVVSVGEYIK